MSRACFFVAQYEVFSKIMHLPPLASILTSSLGLNHSGRGRCDIILIELSLGDLFLIVLQTIVFEHWRECQERPFGTPVIDSLQKVNSSRVRPNLSCKRKACAISKCYSVYSGEQCMPCDIAFSSQMLDLIPESHLAVEFWIDFAVVGLEIFFPGILELVTMLLVDVFLGYLSTLFECCSILSWRGLIMNV